MHPPSPPPFPSSADPRGAVPPPGKPPASRGLSGCAIAAIIGAVALFFGMFVIAILAAIAVPAYHDYLGRSRVHQAYATGLTLQPQIDELRAQSGRCPGNVELGYGDDATIDLGGSEGATGGSRASLTVGALESGECFIELRFEGVSDKIDGRTLVFQSGADGWHCLAGTLEDPQRPVACRRGMTSTP
jgi:type IV pilus assembly protein PilA